MAQRYAVQTYSVMVAIFASYCCCTTSVHSSLMSQYLQRLLKKSEQFSFVYAEHFLARQGDHKLMPQPCEAELNSVSDTSFNEKNNPALIKELMAAFGQDSLWERTEKNYPKEIKKFGKSKKKTKVIPKSVSLTNPLTASWNTLSSLLPFSNGLDLGSNSDSDVYVQFLAQKKWVLQHHLNLDTQQIFRYGATSKNYSETNLNLNQTLRDNTMFSSQFNLSKSQDEDFSWKNYTFHQLSFPTKDKLTYGVFSTGVYEKEKKDMKVSQWGPYFSWRRPLWRNWLYIQNDLNYTDDLNDQHGYHLSYQMTFEANF